MDEEQASQPRQMSAEEMDRLLLEPNGSSALIVAVQSGRADVDQAVEAINRDQQRQKWRWKSIALRICQLFSL
jgi:hypothetical protein